MRQLAPVVAVAAALSLPVAASADAPRSLGAIAAEKEKEKEKDKDKKKQPAKVFTEADLHAGRGGAGTVSRPAAEGGSTAPAGDQKAATDQKAPGDQTAPGGSPKPPNEEELRAAQEKDWRDRLQQARADVARLNDQVNRLQTSLNDMTGPIYGPGRAARQQQLDEAKKNLASMQQAVVTIEEEGRRNRYR